MTLKRCSRSFELEHNGVYIIIIIVNVVAVVTAVARCRYTRTPVPADQILVSDALQTGDEHLEE